MKTRTLLLAIFLSTFCINLYATDTLQVAQEYSEEEYNAAVEFYLDSLESTFDYRIDQINLRNDIAEIEVPAGFKYLDGETSDMILADIWGNPPVEDESMKSLGMLVPAHKSPLLDSTYVINITYSADGYIDDTDAKEIDYDDLLATMKEDAEAENEYRREFDYESFELIGWASPPYYDAENKKLHWAKELKFEGWEEHTLNYNIRILGRKGYLNLNAIGEMTHLANIKDNIDPILSSINFSSGNRYADFNPNIDKIAAVGIGGLIAGKVLTKAGILAKAGIVLVKFWKFLLMGLIAFGAGIRKFFTKSA